MCVCVYVCMFLLSMFCNHHSQPTCRITHTQKIPRYDPHPRSRRSLTPLILLRVCRASTHSNHQQQPKTNTHVMFSFISIHTTIPPPPPPPNTTTHDKTTIYLFHVQQLLFTADNHLRNKSNQLFQPTPPHSTLRSLRINNTCPCPTSDKRTREDNRTATCIILRQRLRAREHLSQRQRQPTTRPEHFARQPPLVTRAHDHTPTHSHTHAHTHPPHTSTH